MADTETRTPAQRGAEAKGNDTKTKESESAAQAEAERKRLEECEKLEADKRERAYPISTGPNYDGTAPALNMGQFAYSGPGGPFNLPANLQWPKWVYHATEAPKQVTNQQELDCLEEGWSTEYIKRDYPKMKFGPNGEYAAVNSPEDEGKLEGNWSDKPPEKPEKQPGQDPRNRTLQELGEAIRDSRRLSLDYGQINQALDSQADNVAMRPISGQDVPWPQYQASETPEQRKAREEAQDAQRRKKEAEDKKENGPKHR